MPLSVLDDLARQALERPNEIAIASPRGDYTFAELATAVDAVSSRLRELGVKAGDLVAVDLPSKLEWIVDLALLRLATKSASVRGVPDTSAVDFGVSVGSPGGRVVPAVLQLQVDELWIADAVSRASAPAPATEYDTPESICWLMLTSGTTGVPRATAYSVRAAEARRDSLVSNWTNGRAEVNFMGMSTAGGLHTAVLNLRFGQAFRAIDHLNEESLAYIADQNIEVLCGAPAQIGRAIELMKSTGIELPTVAEVRMAGAAPSPALLELIDQKFGVPIRNVYGSTEGGPIAWRMIEPGDNPLDAGRTVPEIDVQIVDEDGAQLPAGEVGIIRYRGSGLVSGYLVNGTLVPFAEGWFAPGDTGSLTPDGELILAGRTSDIINISGRKIDPSRVEQLAASFPGVRDAAVFVTESRPGIPELGVAVVTGEGCDLRALDAHLRKELVVGHPTIFWQVAEVPRNRMGKVERRVLEDNFRRRAGS